MKKIAMLMAVVIGMHSAVITALFFVQGCKTTPISPPEPVMPPLSAPSLAPPKVEPAAIAEKAGEVIEYTVKSGDSLSQIAQRHNVRSDELAALNKLADPNRIRIGQKLVIPAHPQAVFQAPRAAEPGTKPSAPALAAGANEYIVQAGDNLSKIASHFGVQVSSLRKANKLQSDKILIGQKLIIPGIEKPEGAPSPLPEIPAESAPAGDVSSDAVQRVSGSEIIHVVMPNEDLSSIAKLYALTVEDIVEANRLGPKPTVQAGQKIIIP